MGRFTGLRIGVWSRRVGSLAITDVVLSGATWSTFWTWGAYAEINK